MLAAVGSAVVELTVAFTVRSPATPQLTGRTLVAVAPEASVPRLQVTLVVGNVLCVQPTGREIVFHASSMSNTSETPSAACGPALVTSVA